MASNPILPGFNPDPSILRVGDDYFIATSTFEYFPGVPIYHSKDLVEWNLIGHVLNRRSQLDMRSVDPGAGVWAPTLRYWKGRYYLATCTVFSRATKPIQPRGFYVSTDDIFDQTKWSEPIYFDLLGIDQDLFFDDDDKVYLSVSRFSRSARQVEGSKLVTYGCEIDLATGDNLTPPVQLRASTQFKGVSEGSHIYKRNGWYYLTTAEGGTGPFHQVWISRSQHPLGPYEPAPESVNPLVFNGENPLVQRTGHGDLVEGKDGRWWIVMLATRPQPGGLGQLGRETFLAPVEWKGDWPVVNKGLAISATIPAELPSSRSLSKWRDEFTAPELDLGWYHLRTPIKPCHRLGSGLTLISNGQRIDQMESPSMLLRKQLAHSGVWSTRMHFDPSSEYEEAGTTIFYSYASYAAILVTMMGQQRVVMARYTDPDTRKVKQSHVPVPAGPIELAIIARPTTYTLSFKTQDQAEFETLVDLSSMVLDGGSESEYEFYFTGAFFGLFNQTTDGDAGKDVAVVEWAQFDPES